MLPVVISVPKFLLFLNFILFKSQMSVFSFPCPASHLKRHPHCRASPQIPPSLARSAESAPEEVWSWTVTQGGFTAQHHRDQVSRSLHKNSIRQSHPRKLLTGCLCASCLSPLPWVSFPSVSYGQTPSLLPQDDSLLMRNSTAFHTLLQRPWPVVACPQTQSQCSREQRWFYFLPWSNS